MAPRRRRRAVSVNELIGLTVDQRNELRRRGELSRLAAIAAQLPLSEPEFPTPWRYGDRNTMPKRSTLLPRPYYIQIWEESEPGHRCPLAISGCTCYIDDGIPLWSTLGLPGTTGPEGGAPPGDVSLPLAPQGFRPAQASMTPPVAVTPTPVPAPPPAPLRAQNETGVSASGPVHIQPPNSASQALGARTNPKRKRSEDEKMPEDPRAKRPSLDPSIEPAPRYTGLSAPRNDRTRVSAAASPPLEVQSWESSLLEDAQFDSYDATWRYLGPDNRRSREAAFVASQGPRGTRGALHTSTPISVSGSTCNRERNMPSTYPPPAYSSRPPGVAEAYFNQNRKRSQPSEPSGEPKAKRSRGATPPPNMIAQQRAFRLGDPTHAPNPRISPARSRRQVTPVTRNRPLEGLFDMNRCRTCLGLDGENGHPVGAMICCSNEEAHGTDEHWFHFLCVGLDIAPAEDEQWYCWEYKDEMGPASDRASSSIPSTEDESSDDDDDNTAPKKKPLKRNYAPSASGTMPGQAATNRNTKGANWSTSEKAYVTTLMHEVMQDERISKTEKRWVKVGELLQQRYNVTRTATAIKNYWNREGRSTSGLDERNKKNPNKLITGVQDPEDRKALRAAKKNQAKKAELKAEEDIEEEVYQPTTKVTKPIKSTKRSRPFGDESDDDSEDYDHPRIPKRQKRHP